MNPKSIKKKQGFATLPKGELIAVSARGGSKEVPKGFSMLSVEELRANASRAAHIRWDAVKARRRLQAERP